LQNLTVCAALNRIVVHLRRNLLSLASLIRIRRMIEHATIRCERLREERHDIVDVNPREWQVHLGDKRVALIVLLLQANLVFLGQLQPASNLLVNSHESSQVSVTDVLTEYQPLLKIPKQSIVSRFVAERVSRRHIRLRQWNFAMVH
jgi:hypothetical protein